MASGVTRHEFIPGTRDAIRDPHWNPNRFFCRPKDSSLGIEVQVLTVGAQTWSRNFAPLLSGNLGNSDQRVIRTQHHDLHVATILGYKDHPALLINPDVVDSTQRWLTRLITDPVEAGCNVVLPNSVVTFGGEHDDITMDGHAFSTTELECVGQLTTTWRVKEPCNKYRCVKNPILIAPIFGYNAPIAKMMPPELQ